MRPSISGGVLAYPSPPICLSATMLGAPIHRPRFAIAFQIWQESAATGGRRSPSAHGPSTYDSEFVLREGR